MTDIKRKRQSLQARILNGDGRCSATQRREAFEGLSDSQPLGELLQKVRMSPHSVSDGDVERALAAGLSEDQLFELVVCAAVGQSARQYDAALAALAAVSGEE